MKTDVIKIVRELSDLFSVSPNDLSKTIQRFKDDIEDTKKEIKYLKSTP